MNEETNITTNSYLSSIKTSPEIDKITVARIKLRAKIRGESSVKKNGKNTHNGQIYSTLDDYIDAIEPHLEDFGLLFEQHEISSPDGIKGIASKITHVSGQWVASEYYEPEYVVAEAGKKRTKHRDGSTSLEVASGINAIQEMGCNSTYMKKYAISSMFFLRGDDDTDGNPVASSSTPQKKSYSKDKPISDAQLKLLLHRLKDKPSDTVSNLVKRFSINKLEDLTMANFSNVLAWVDEQ